MKEFPKIEPSSTHFKPAMPAKQRRFEIVMVILTGLGKILFVDVLDVKFIYVIAAIAFWVIYFIRRISKKKELIKYWGLSFSNARETFQLVTIVGLIVLGGFVLYGWFMGTLRFHWHILIILLIYPAWGLVQQFLMMSLFAGNLKDYESKHFNKTLIVILTSILFSLVHYPSYQLIIATFIMALFYSIVFLSKRNIIPLGIFHGVLGGVFYFLVLNRDPWMEFIELLNK